MRQGGGGGGASMSSGLRELVNSFFFLSVLPHPGFVGWDVGERRAAAAVCMYAVCKLAVRIRRGNGNWNWNWSWNPDLSLMVQPDRFFVVVGGG